MATIFYLRWNWHSPLRRSILRFTGSIPSFCYFRKLTMLGLFFPQNLTKVLKRTIHSNTCLMKMKSLFYNMLKYRYGSITCRRYRLYNLQQKTVASTWNKGHDLIEKLLTYNTYRCMAYRKKKQIVYADLHKLKFYQVIKILFSEIITATKAIVI